MTHKHLKLRNKVDKNEINYNFNPNADIKSNLENRFKKLKSNKKHRSKRKHNKKKCVGPDTSLKSSMFL